MSARAHPPRYIPPPTTFLLSRSGATYGEAALPNKNWNKVRENVQNNGLKSQNGSSAYGDNQGSGNSGHDPQRRQRKGFRNGDARPWGDQSHRMREPNGRAVTNMKERLERPVSEREQQQKIEKQQHHYAKPDNNTEINDNADCDDDKINGRGGKAQTGGERNPNETDGDARRVPLTKAGYEDDVDWQKKADNGSYDWSKKKRQKGSVYDPEVTKIRAEKIDEEGNQDKNINGSLDANGDGLSNGSSQGKDDRWMKRPTNAEATRQEKESSWSNGTEDGDGSRTSVQSETGHGSSGSMESDERKPGDEAVESETDSDDQSEDSKANGEGEGPKDGKTRRLKSILKKCRPKFADKLLDAIEEQKKNCTIRFDDICKKHKQKDGTPIFTSYSCENGGEEESFRSSMKKKLRNLAGGIYVRACDGVEKVKEAAGDWLDEMKPNNDGSWSQVEGEYGTRCVPHENNTIEDHTIYVCSCCFNELIDRDAYVNIKYFDAEYGCCKPKIVSRSFENRPYFCEKLLQSMSEKRREIFLKIHGKRHQMRGGIHCVSKIPSMEAEFLAQQSTLQTPEAKNDGEENGAEEEDGDINREDDAQNENE